VLAYLDARQEREIIARTVRVIDVQTVQS